MQKVVVYSKTNCPSCRQTRLFLDRHKIDYVSVPLADADGNLYHKENQAILDTFIAKGYQQYPIVEVEFEDGVESWSGFQPRKLKRLVKDA